VFVENIKNTISKTFGLGSPKGEFGIEIETEGRDLPDGRITKTFTGHTDGSLRNGMEYVSIPIDHKEIETCVNNLRGELTGKYGAVIAPTYRSSTHIHQNFTSRPWSDVLGTTILWTMVEPLVFSIFPHRDGSLFCMSSYDTGDMTKNISEICDELGYNFGNRGFRPRGKYSSLNMGRLGDLGTLEFRVFPSSVDGGEISRWAKWLVNLREIVQAEDDKSYLTLVKVTEQNPFPFVERLFDGFPVAQHTVPPLIDFGARQAYELARVVNQKMREKVKPREDKKGKKPFNIPAGELRIEQHGRLADMLVIDDVIPNDFPIPQLGDAVPEVAPAQPVPGFQRRRNAAVGRPVGQPPAPAGEVDLDVAYWRGRFNRYSHQRERCMRDNRPREAERAGRMIEQARQKLAERGVVV
jgi:hypothetical protein